MDNKRIIRYLGRLTWVAVLLLAVAGLFSSVNKRKVSLSSDIDVRVAPLEGLDSTLIRRNDVLDILSSSFEENVLGNQIKRIDIARIEEVLEKNAFVKNADAYLDADNVINIEISQRAPIMRVMDHDGRDYYLDDKGIFMPTSKHYTARVPVLTGYIPPHVPDLMTRENYLLKNLFDLIHIFRANEFYLALVEQIHVSQNGDILLIPKIGNHQILLGKYLNIEAKLKRLKIFYNEAAPYEGWQKYKLIDIRFENQIVCKR